jgi:hypothetical protein
MGATAMNNAMTAGRNTRTLMNVAGVDMSNMAIYESKGFRIQGPASSLQQAGLYPATANLHTLAIKKITIVPTTMNITY